MFISFKIKKTIMDAQLFRRLNNLRYTNYEQIANFVSTGAFPKTANTQAKRERYAAAYQGFEVHNGRLKFAYDLQATPPVRLEVLKPDEIDEVLEAHYDDLETGVGTGVQRFYEFISTKYLGVSRARVERFLKAQVSYQLTRKTTLPKNPSKKYTAPNQAWSADLIDMSNLSGQNRGWNWILSCLDLYTRKVWLRKIKKKEASQIRDAFATFCTPENQPRTLLIDNGTEFKQDFGVWLNQRGIKVANSRSHTPLGDIENINGQVRKVIAEIAVRNRTKIWYSHLDDIEANLNNHSQTWKSRERREAKAEKVQERNANKPPVQPKFVIGQLVRVKQAAFLSKVREKNKAGLMKEIYVKYGVLTYRIRSIIGRNVANTFHMYRLNYMNGRPVQQNGVILQYRESDLMAVPETRRGVELTPEQSNQLNRI